MAGIPGYDIEILAGLGRSGTPTDIGKWFVVGQAPAAVTDRIRVYSIDEYDDTAGVSSGTAVLLRNSLETFFNEGGGEAWISPVGVTAPATEPVTADWQTAFDRFTSDLGPGQVSAPGITTAAIQAIVNAHVRATNRIAFLDVAQGADFAALNALTSPNARDAATWGRWVQIPGVAEGGGTRVAPGSAAAAGVTARFDSAAERGVAAPIVEYGRLQYALDSVGPAFTDGQRTTLTEAGINLVGRDLGPLALNGFRSSVTAADDPWLALSDARLVMSVVAGIAPVQRMYFGRAPTATTANDLRGDLEGVVRRFYDAGLLEDSSPDGTASGPEFAYRVEVRRSAEPGTVGALTAGVFIRPAGFVEFVQVAVVKVPVSGTVAA